MRMQECPVCEWDDTVNQDSPLSSTCTCEACGARFKVEEDADFNGDHYVDCSTVGERIPDPNPVREAEFSLRSAPPGTRVRNETGEYVRLVDDLPYIQSAWACLSTGKVLHYSYLLKGLR